MTEFLRESLMPLLLSNMAIAAILALLALLVHRRERGARLAHCLWVLCLLKLVTPPVYQIEVPQWDQPTVAPTSRVAANPPAPTPATRPPKDLSIAEIEAFLRANAAANASEANEKLASQPLRPSRHT